MEIPQTITQLYRDYENGEWRRFWLRCRTTSCSNSRPVRERPGTPACVATRTSCPSIWEMLPRTFNSTRITQRTSWSMRVASQSQVHRTYKASGRSFSTTIAHCWSFKDGIPVHLVEYMDTALIAGQSAPTEGDAPSVHA